MNNEQIEKKELKKQQLKDKLAANQQSAFLTTWWIEMAISIKETQIEWSLEYLAVVNQNQYDFWIEKLKLAPWKDFSFPDTVFIFCKDEPCY